eukprot:TRINITY_DN3479_c0_g1_i6.p1 TRINITY_DN3479_c0_g1~~TRINITY_DN3479_c0_g1_i6.p1  ORF type:complete len:107 (+),score=7.55 TRINITY_DN3479_c0_g1_i6:86-406(+)
MSNERGTTVQFLVDNTSVIGALRKGMSTASATAAAVARILRRLDAAGTAASVSYINTKKNPADAPSRVPLWGVDKAAVHAQACEFFDSSVVSSFVPLYGHSSGYGG